MTYYSADHMMVLKPVDEDGMRNWLKESYAAEEEEEETSSPLENEEGLKYTGFAMLPSVVLAMGPSREAAFLFWTYLDWIGFGGNDSRGKPCTLTARRLAKRLKCSTSTVKKARDELAALGLIVVEPVNLVEGSKRPNNRRIIVTIPYEKLWSVNNAYVTRQCRRNTRVPEGAIDGWKLEELYSWLFDDVPFEAVSMQVKARRAKG